MIRRIFTELREKLDRQDLERTEARTIPGFRDQGSEDWWAGSNVFS